MSTVIIKKTSKYKIWKATTISLLFFNENVFLLCFRQNVWLKIETIGKKLKWKKGTNHKSKIYFLQIGTIYYICCTKL